jgi:L-asparaginase II
MFRPSSKASLKVHVYRGHLIESVHFVDALVLDQQGQHVLEMGSYDEPIYPRSAIKMLQALSLIASGAHEKFKLNAKQISVACSSHMGDELHTTEVMNWLGKMGLSESNLVCGAHEPYDKNAAIEIYKKNESFGRRHNNCSGKHSGLLATCLMLGFPIEGYHEHSHPLQVRLRKMISETCGESIDHTQWGIDGCGIPTYSMSLKAMATGMAQFANPQFQWAQEAEVLKKAIALEPHYISGRECMNTDTIRATKGEILLKSGAEGVCCVVDLRKGYGMALKCHDGGARAVEAAALAILQKLNCFKPEEHQALSKWMDPPLRNWSGTEVGQIRVDLNEDIS